MTYTPTKNSQRRGGRKFSKWDGASSQERFWAKVDKSPGQGPEGDCWGWLASTVSGGYGHFRVGGKNVRAHRFSYELHHGPIPEGKIVRHSCDNPPCPNPDHLLLGTDQDNADDRVRRGRSSKGEEHPDAKLTSKDVPIIRHDTRPTSLIAADYGVSAGNIRRIKAGTRWRHIQEAA